MSNDEKAKLRSILQTLTDISYLSYIEILELKKQKETNLKRIEDLDRMINESKDHKEILENKVEELFF